jgi:DNA transformation protein
LRGAEDPDHIAELFAAFGLVRVRRMFGGAGLFADGLMFGLVEDGVIYLKADAQTIPAYEREGLRPFSYATKTGARTLTSYWRLPERLYDDPEELAKWTREALRAARRTFARKSSIGRPRPKSARKRR